MKRALQFVFWALLLGLGFVAGMASKNSDSLKAESPNEADAMVADIDTLVTSSRLGTTAPNKGLTPEERHTVELFEQAASSVAFITTSNVRRDYWTRDVTEIPRGSGSGFIWDKKGHIITNYHVIKGADRAQITLADQSNWTAELVRVASS